MPHIQIVVARARNGVIGRNNALPWRLPEDLAHFKRVTIGHPIIMGRKTWESIARPLPGRRNIVVTRDPAWSAAGAECAGSVEKALLACASEERLSIIGGASLYAEAMAHAHELIVTEIGRDFDGDVFFPPIDAAMWREVSRETHSSSGGDALDFAFVRYLRRRKNAA